MALYVVVHHHRDASQPWANSWLDDQRLHAITTTREIGRLCAQALRQNDRVYVHRCACGANIPTICCSVSVQRVSNIDHSTDLVEFDNPIPFNNRPPPVQPTQGQNFYIC